MTATACLQHPNDTSFVAPRCTEELRELFRDEHLIVVSKPAGLLSVPGRDPRNHDSATSRLKKSEPSIGVVHRLDMDTSGLMVFARSAVALSKLHQQFSNRAVRKQYMALVDGRVSQARGQVDLPLICDWPNRPRQKVCHEFGKPSLTHWQRVEGSQFPDATRLQLSPVTGRSHQLRVHMAAIGHPILGCRFYGSEQSYQRYPRLCLHAEGLAFQHPITSEELDFYDPAPF